jgi:hypothetical protein
VTSCGNDEGTVVAACCFERGSRRASLGCGVQLVFDSRQAKNCFVLQRVRNVSGAHPAFPLICTEGCLSEVERSLTSRLF